MNRMSKSKKLDIGLVKQAESRVSEEDRERLEEMLDALSQQEREAFILVKGRGFSQYEAARLMGVSRDTAKTLLDRAERKFTVSQKTGVQRIMFCEILRS